MKITRLILSVWIGLILSSCLKDPNDLTALNSESFHESQVQVHFQPLQSVTPDYLLTLSPEQNLVIKELDEMLYMTSQLRQSPSDSLWHQLSRKWNAFNDNYFGKDKRPYGGSQQQAGSSKGELFPKAMLKWAELNTDLVKLSGEVRFGDALEILLYNTKGVVFPESLLKSVIFTHIFDQIFVNVIGPSSMEYQHTTGGSIKLIQQTDYPRSNEMILVCECNDLRYMDVFIRIPSWAVNPSVSHGNVKYVAHPGEYCQVSKKWKTGDELRVVFKQ